MPSRLKSSVVFTHITNNSIALMSFKTAECGVEQKVSIVLLRYDACLQLAIRLKLKMKAIITLCWLVATEIYTQAPPSMPWQTYLLVLMHCMAM